MNVLVTGGTGFVGQAVVRHLHKAGHRILLLARNPAGRTAQQLAERHRAEVYGGDLVNGGDLKPAMEAAEAIIHLVGIISEVESQTFENVHVGATRTLLEAAQGAEVSRIVHMSALGARPGAVSRYHQTKYTAEECVRGANLAWTIFRPSLIYGPGDGFVNLFARISRFSPIVPVIGSGHSLFQPISVESVARCFVEALSESRAEGGTFDLCGVESLTLDEIVETIMRVMDRRRIRVRVPVGLAKLQAVFLERFYPLLLRRAAPLNRDQVIMLEEGNVGDGQPSRDLFGWSDPPFAAGIATYLGSDLKS